MRDLVSAVMLLTRIPVRGSPTQPAARAVWAWPVVGLGVGAAMGAVLALGQALGAVPILSAALAVALGCALTGALHEDGLADVADGFWGGRDRDRRLAIMRDSRLGSYGAVALTLTLLARVALLAAAAEQGQAWAVPIAAAMASRAAMPAVMRVLPPARAGGLSHGAGRPTARGATLATLIGALPLAWFGWPGLGAASAAALAVAGLALVARAKIGGQTGDVCGAAQQVAELAVLAVLTLR
ncbi:adenosylcobinamide-GDP ribazoletransferase [Jannaschia sp. LMIT008]|uniref:adenosylcobinamide-GDP ribazoletransferase n=1 Tax=Jannaschia maritima TaxID=3032585 RepID=UPI0028111239|nr:adenosylcobinamide-GDP ribazoletransferase [Jannaschia sp. LMIT008]